MKAEKKKSSKVLPLLIALVAVIIIVILLIRGCPKTPPQETGSPPKASRLEKRESEEVEISQRKKGRLLVSGNNDFVVVVYSGEGKERKEAATGFCSLPVDLAPGQYSCAVKVNDEVVPVGAATIEADKTTTLDFKGFGLVFVECPKFMAEYSILSDGMSIANGKASINKLGLAVGDYQVHMKIAGLDIKKDVTIAEGKTSTVVIDEIGMLCATGLAFNKKYQVLNTDGEAVATGGLGVSKIPLPVGDYEIEIEICGKKMKTPVSIKGQRKQNNVALKNHGLLWVEYSKFGTEYSVRNESRKTIAKGGAKVNSVALPNGKYTVHCADLERPIEINGKKITVTF